MSMLLKVEVLRAEALKEAMASPTFDMVRALDAAVVAAGGKSLLVVEPTSKPNADLPKVASNLGGTQVPTKKVSQGDAAALALQESGPLQVGSLQEATEAKGAVFRGENPIPSFRSMLSKDERFYSINHNNKYLWWLKGVDLPKEFMPEPIDIDDLLGSGSNTSEKGGDGHAANNT